LDRLWFKSEGGVIEVGPEGFETLRGSRLFRDLPCTNYGARKAGVSIRSKYLAAQ
jgi:hypothetical protein